MEKEINGIVSVSPSAVATIIKYGGERYKEEQRVLIKGYTGITKDELNRDVYHFTDGEQITKGRDSLWDPIAAQKQKKV